MSDAKVHMVDRNAARRALRNWHSDVDDECRQETWIAREIAAARAAGYAAGVKDEREACSLECEAVCPPAGLYSPGERSAYEAAVQDCAAAIRARSEGGKA